MTATRETIAAALSTAPGIKGHKTRPKALSRGDAYPLVGALIRGRGLSFAYSWRIVLILGGDERKADDMLPDALVDIAVALQEADVLYVDSAVPFIVTTEAGDIYAAEITGRGE